MGCSSLGVVARDNPFRAERIESLRYRAPGFSREAILRRLTDLHGRGAIIGPKGRGKTSLMLELSGWLKAMNWDARYLRLGEGWRREGKELKSLFGRSSDTLWADAAGQEDRVVYLLDGAEQLGWMEWRQVLSRTRHTAGLVVTTHLPGRLETLYECRTSPEMLEELVAELLREEPAGQVHPTADELKVLFDRHDGNIREALRDLYDRWSRQAA
jgi:hypothetical protein